jgi:methyl-accepting chemotaxis protein
MTMKLAARLWAPTLTLIVMLAVMATAAAVRTRSLIESAGQAQQDQQTRLAVAYQWQGEVEAQAVRVGGQSDASGLQQAQQRMQAHRDRLATLLVTPEEKAMVAALSAPMNTPEQVLTVRQAAQQLVSHEEAKTQALYAQTAAERMRTVWTVSGVMALVAAVLAVAAAYLVRTVRQPLAELASAARRIGDGDLTVALDISRADEIGDVMRSVVAMRDGLRQIVGQVQESAQSIHLASREVSMGNLDLSQRTERAAVNLQRAASGMQELSDSMQHSAASAHQAHQLVDGASDVAQRGGKAMVEVVSTMDQINNASRKIGDIISVIDGIAFQTNILALNAAVEAARAGEQGRGFAVVAGEVRTLAGRSADAARDIKGLITSSVDSTGNGARQVHAAGSTMGDIVDAVQKVSAMIRTITQDTQVQSQGVGALHEAVAELDQMTQQNAALVEQSAAAAESLNEQAGRLTRVVGTFRLPATT